MRGKRWGISWRHIKVPPLGRAPSSHVTDHDRKRRWKGFSRASDSQSVSRLALIPIVPVSGCWVLRIRSLGFVKEKGEKRVPRLWLVCDRHIKAWNYMNVDNLWQNPPPGSVHTLLSSPLPILLDLVGLINGIGRLCRNLPLRSNEPLIRNLILGSFIERHRENGQPVRFWRAKL